MYSLRGIPKLFVYRSELVPHTRKPSKEGADGRNSCRVWEEANMAEQRIPLKSPKDAGESRKLDSGYVQAAEADREAACLPGARTKGALPQRYLHRPQSQQSDQQHPCLPTTVPIQEIGYDPRLVSRPACSNSECSAAFDCLQRENDELRRRLEAFSATNEALQQENVELRKTVEGMKQRITCSEIVEGHSHLKEKCEELHDELETMKKLNRNAEVADQNKAERIDIFSTRLATVKKKLKDKEDYIERLHEQLAEVFVKLEIEKHDAQKLSEVKEQLERELQNAQAENQAYLEELWEHLAQIRDMKDLMYTLREELEQERKISRDVIRRTSSKSKDRPWSVPVFAQGALRDQGNDDQGNDDR